MITLNAIWESSTGLLKRFDLMPTPDIAWKKHVEETGELIEALYILNLKDHRSHFQFRKDVAMEACDCLVTLLNALYAVGFTFEQLGVRKHQIHNFWVVADATYMEMRPAVFELLSSDAAFHKHFIEIQCLTGDEGLDARFDLGKQLLIAVRALINLVKQGGISLDEFEGAIESVMFKNGKKTRETHIVIDGFIKKIQPATLIEEN